MAFDAHDAEFDEYRGGSRSEHCYISFPKDGDAHKATSEVWPWADAGSHDEARVIVACVYVEALFAEAPVPPQHTKALVAHGFLTKCLSEDYWGDVLQALVEEGLFHERNDEGTATLISFDDINVLERRADKIMLALKDDPRVPVSVREGLGQ